MKLMRVGFGVGLLPLLILSGCGKGESSMTPEEMANFKGGPSGAPRSAATSAGMASAQSKYWAKHRRPDAAGNQPNAMPGGKN